MQVLLQINDAFVPSIAAARADYNARFPATVTVDANGNPLPPGQTLPNPALINDDVSFMQSQNGDLIKGWVKEYGKLAGPVIIDGVPQEVTASQAYQELIAQGLHDLDPTKSQVEACINQIADPVEQARVRTRFEKSAVFERQDPDLIALWTGPAPYGLAKTLADLDQTFINASKRS